MKTSKPFKLAIHGLLALSFLAGEIALAGKAPRTTANAAARTKSPPRTAPAAKSTSKNADAATLEKELADENSTESAAAAAAPKKNLTPEMAAENISNFSADYDPKEGAVQLSGRFPRECASHLSIKSEGTIEGSTAVFRITDDTGHGLECLAKNKAVCAGNAPNANCIDMSQLMNDKKLGARYQTRYQFTGEKPANPQAGLASDGLREDGKTMTTVNAFNCARLPGPDSAYSQTRELQDINNRALADDDSYRKRRRYDDDDDYDRRRRRRHRDRDDDDDDDYGRRRRHNHSLTAMKAFNASLQIAALGTMSYYTMQPGGLYGFGFNYGMPSYGYPGYGGVGALGGYYGAMPGGYFGNYGAYTPSPVLGTNIFGPTPLITGPVAPVAPIAPIAPVGSSGGTRTR